MAAIVYSTALKTTALARVAVATDDRFLNPNEQGARVRVAEIDFVADGAVSTPVIIGKFDKPVKLLDIVLLTDDDGVADFDAGVTPISSPVDTDQSLGVALALATATPLHLPLAINMDITAPSYVFVSPQTGTIANTKYLKGYILYVDGT